MDGDCIPSMYATTETSQDKGNKKNEDDLLEPHRSVEAALRRLLQPIQEALESQHQTQQNDISSFEAQRDTLFDKMTKHLSQNYDLKQKISDLQKKLFMGQMEIDNLITALARCYAAHYASEVGHHSKQPTFSEEEESPTKKDQEGEETELQKHMFIKNNGGEGPIYVGDSAGQFNLESEFKEGSGTSYEPEEALSPQANSIPQSSLESRYVGLIPNSVHAGGIWGNQIVAGKMSSPLMGVITPEEVVNDSSEGTKHGSHEKGTKVNPGVAGRTVLWDKA